MTTITKTFAQTGDFDANNAAEKWCAANGISYGRMQRDDPRGLMYGDYDIQKWRNLSSKDIAQLDGRMTGDMRNGPITVTINAPTK